MMTFDFKISKILGLVAALGSKIHHHNAYLQMPLSRPAIILAQ